MMGDMFTARQVVLERLRVAWVHEMGVERATTMPTVDLDHYLDRLVIQFRREVLAQKLPPQRASHTFLSPRHASWWDHLKATYRGRWWWPRLLSHVSYVDVPVSAHISFRNAWAYPAARPLREEMLGQPVLWVDWGVDEDGI